MWKKWGKAICQLKFYYFNSVLLGLVDQIKISLMLKIKWKQHHILCILLTNIIWGAKKTMLNREGTQVLTKDRSTKTIKMCWVLEKAPMVNTIDLQA